MARPIPTDYALARKILTGVLDPSGLKLVFEADGNRVFCHVDANEAVCGKAKTVPAGVVQSVVDDLGHAAAAALKRRVGVTRECKVRFLKPLYAGEAFRADGTVLREAADVVVVGIRLLNKREQLCIEAETEIFPLSADQVRKMAPDGALPPDLKKYLP